MIRSTERPVSYSLNACMPVEGYHLAFNGTHGRVEVRMYERQSFEAPVGRDEILVLGSAPRCPVPTMATRRLFVCTAACPCPVSNNAVTIIAAGALSTEPAGERLVGDPDSAAEVPVAGTTPARRPRDPDRTRNDILAAARAEFVEHGFEGARVDRIAARAGSNKRMLYHYIGNKEALYARVLHDAYRDIRSGERELRLDLLPPRLAMERLVGFTFDHFRANPWFIRLLATENIQRGAYVREIPDIHALNSPLVTQVAEVLAAGVAEGVFRKGVDPLQLYITLTGVSYFYLSNIHTLSVAFDAPLDSEGEMARRRAHAIEVVIGYLENRLRREHHPHARPVREDRGR